MLNNAFKFLPPDATQSAVMLQYIEHPYFAVKPVIYAII